MYASKVYEMAVDSYGDVRTLVRGLPYQCPDDWEEVLDSIDEDSNLYLIKEPDNPKDPLAIAAYLDDRRVGYVASSDNGKIWLYMTDEKMPCTFIERFDASFKISFENPRILFEDKPFIEIYRDKSGIIDRPNPTFEIPFLTDSKNKHYEWFDDRIVIADLEKAIPDFRRKLATRIIIIAGRKNSNGEYYYYLPYLNMPIADVEDSLVQKLIDKYGFVIALPDVPILNSQGGIFMDLHVTYLKETNFKEFDAAHQSELVFNLVRDNDDKYQFTADNSSASNEFDSYVDEQEEVDLFMNEPQSTPSYSKSDYILKKGEIITSTIDKSAFNRIDKITTDLFEFVRQTLFPSTELFSYLKKYTPYYDQFYDFGQFETLIRVLVVKDLGRIYKGLNHSFNFDTKEGKPLFLYMDKETGESTDISYEVFAQICDSKTQYEPIVKMRKIIGDLTKSFYEYNIVLWSDSDFMIHGFLRNVNKEWAKRYMELMRQFASAVSGGKGQAQNSSVDSIKDNSSAIDEFFPIFGITLGKTTWKQAEDMGHVVEIWKEGPSRYTDIGNVTFWDHKGEGRFMSLSLYNDIDVPPLWKSRGFSWDLSYDKWTDMFRKYGFNISVTRQPCQKEYAGRNTLSAEFKALSSDGSLSFMMRFDYGKKGHHTSSPNTLYSIYVDYNCLITVGMSQVNSEGDGKPGEMMNQDEKVRIQEAVFQHCIYDVLGVKLKDTPNNKWKYESWNVFGDTYETYIFSYPDVNKAICKKCEAIVNRNRNTNYEFKGLYVETVLLLLYHYRRVYDSSYQFEQCKEEYFKILDDPIGRINIETTPWLSISRSDGYSIGDSRTAKYDVLLYTSLYNNEYIDALITQGELITIFK